MSRSYKKSPINKDRNSKWGKCQAGRAVRRAADVHNGNRFKKLYCSWDICDWRHRGQSYTVEQFRRAWFDFGNEDLNWARDRFNSWKIAYRYWLRCYKRK